MVLNLYWVDGLPAPDWKMWWLRALARFLPGAVCGGARGCLISLSSLLCAPKQVLMQEMT